MTKKVNNFNDTGVMKVAVFMTPVSFFYKQKAAKMAA
ncbi:hypothetical protein N476_12180 [Pseudoalteromonas luteoviolacea H33]|uniref:Uncharacterized protein n=1 Tax=Pseudoalteromonas luteoviolacea H33 TaxID=1365251 RepID=A0A167F368_9GAMM|nr:hypothetical protein N476_12180 [Pseudoalteromonas luteoviolacea H33]KZN79165.1 hypothetical protein N477_06590 [Pseudoalteromonas luteoviolacea H33-S]